MLNRLRGNMGLGLLLIRVALAAVFITHGVGKFMALDQTIGFFSTLGLPAIMAYVIAAIETLGGLAMLLGLWVELAGVLLALVMVGAIYLVKGQMGWGGFELELTLLLASLGIALTGAGRYAVKK